MLQSSIAPSNQSTNTTQLAQPTSSPSVAPPVTQPLTESSMSDGLLVAVQAESPVEPHCPAMSLTPSASASPPMISDPAKSPMSSTSPPGAIPPIMSKMPQVAVQANSSHPAAGSICDSACKSSEKPSVAVQPTATSPRPNPPKNDNLADPVPTTEASKRPVVTTLSVPAGVLTSISSPSGTVGQKRQLGCPHQFYIVRICIHTTCTCDQRGLSVNFIFLNDLLAR